MTKKERKMEIIGIIDKLNDLQYKVFIKSLDDSFTLKEIDSFNDAYATKNNHISTTSIKKNDTLIGIIYEREIRKINLLLDDNEIVKQLNGLRILFYGGTGTGKTSVIEKIISENKIKKIQIKASELINSRMGQTQLNLFNKSVMLNEMNGKVILFIDELDSIIMSRTYQNDSAEHSRIVASFLNFLDGLNNNIIVIAATNVIQSIDTAVERRFDIKIEGKYFDFDKFMKMLKSETKISISTFETNLLKKGFIEKKFSISELKSFQNHLLIEAKMKTTFTVFGNFVDFFSDKIDLNIMDLSDKKKTELKGIING